MYYKSQVEGVVRIDPRLFGEKLQTAVEKQLKADLEGQSTPELGKVIAVLSIDSIEEGTIIPGDGAAFHKTRFTALHFLPEINELVEGEVKDIAKFGAFIDFGPFEGMVHVSQTMDDFVSFNKAGSLTGKQSGHALKQGDRVRARIVAVSYKEASNPKIGLTMRQPYLGKLEWIDDLVKGVKKPAPKKKEEDK